MTRLPIPGSDDGSWGNILNDFLGQAHNSDGSLKAGVISSAQLDSATQTALTKATSSVQSVNGKTPNGAGAVTLAASDVGAPTTLTGLSDVNTAGASGGQVLSFDAGTSTWTSATVTSTTVSDATTTSKGIVQLAGDLGGTAAGPSVVAVKGVNIMGSPSTNQVLTALSPSTAGWASPATPAVDWINVKSAPYSAVGDGATDDTTAILAAISAATAGTQKKTVYFPAGIYKMTQGITLVNGLTLMGEATHEKEFEKRAAIHNSTTDTFVWGGSGATDATQRPKDILIKGIAFSGGITSTYFITPVASDASGAYPYHLIIEECGIHNYISIYSGATQALTIKDCYLNNCSSTTLNLSGSDSYIMRNFIGGFLQGYGTATSPVVILAIAETTFAENYLTCASTMGIKVTAPCLNLRIINNEINGLLSGGSPTYGATNALWINSARGVLVLGNGISNVCQSPTGINDSAITISDSSDVVVTNNHIDSLQNAAARHIRITQSSATVQYIKVGQNVYTTGTSHTNPRIVTTGTMSNIWLDDWWAVGKTVAGVPSDASYPAAPPDGTIAINTSNNGLYFRSNGTWQVGATIPNNVVYSQFALTATTTITNTTTETLLGSYTIPAGSCVAGDTYRIRVAGTCDIGTSAGNLSFLARIGGVAGNQIVGLTWALGSSALSTKAFFITFEVTFRSAASASVAVVGAAQGVNNIVTTGQSQVNYLATTADMTSAKDLAISAQFSVADASHTVRTEILTIDKVR